MILDCRLVLFSPCKNQQTCGHIPTPLCRLVQNVVFEQGPCGSWKTGKVLELYYGIFRDWKVLEKTIGPGKFWKSVKKLFCVRQ